MGSSIIDQELFTANQITIGTEGVAMESLNESSGERARRNPGLPLPAWRMPAWHNLLLSRDQEDPGHYHVARLQSL